MANLIEVVLRANDQASKEIMKVSQAAGTLNSATNEASKGGVSNLGDSVKTLAAQALGAVGVVAGFGVAVKKAFDLAEEGAQITQTTESFNSLMERFDAAPDILDRLKDASRGTISEFDIMSSTMTLVAGASDNLGRAMVDAAPQLMEIAKAANKLNPALGDTTFFYNSLATGIKRGQPLIIDNLGLTLKVGDATERYAASLGKSVDALSAEERNMAILNDVLRAGSVMMEQAGDSADAAQDSFARLAVAMEETGNAAKQKLAPFLADAAEAMALLLTWNEKIQGALDDQVGRLETTASSYDEYATGVMAAASAAGTAVSAFVDRTIAMEGEAVAIERLVEAGMILSETQWAMERSAAGTTAAIESTAGAAFRLAGDAQAAASGMSDAEFQSRELAMGMAEAEAATQGMREAAASLAGDLGNLDFSTQAMWKQVEQLAGSTDLGDAAVRRLAVGMGLVTEADLRAYDARNQLLTAMAEGAEVTGALLLVTQDLSTYETEAAAAAQEAARGNAELAAQHQAAADSALRQAEKIVELTTKTDALSNAYGRVPPSVETKIEQPGMGPAMSAAQNYKAILDAIPAEKRTRIIQEYVTIRGGSPIAGGGSSSDNAPPEYQTGTPYVPQNMLAFLHQGEMVIPPAEAAEMRRGAKPSTIVIAPVIMDAGRYTDATGSVAFADIGGAILQQLEGVL